MCTSLYGGGFVAKQRGFGGNGGEIEPVIAAETQTGSFSLHFDAGTAKICQPEEDEDDRRGLWVHYGSELPHAKSLLIPFPTSLGGSERARE